MSTPNFTEFVLSSDGTIEERTISVVKKQVSAEMLASLGDAVPRHMPLVFKHPELGRVDLSIAKDNYNFSARLKELHLKAPYTFRDGVLFPNFTNPNEPMFNLAWTPPAGMKLVFITECMKFDERIKVGFCHLLAFDTDKRCYRLPLANLFDDSHICMGNEWPTVYPDGQSAFNAALEQFQKSEWNADLFDNPQKQERSRQLFRFEPESKGFNQLAPSADWKSLCYVVSPSILNSIVL